MMCKEKYFIDGWRVVDVFSPIFFCFRVYFKLKNKSKIMKWSKQYENGIIFLSF